jgi:hypothetical protein
MGPGELLGAPPIRALDPQTHMRRGPMRRSVIRLFTVALDAWISTALVCAMPLVASAHRTYAEINAGVSSLQPFSACLGDCNGNGQVTIDDLLTLVNIALGSAQPLACPDGVPSGDNVDIALILQAVSNALHGCPPPDVSGTWREDQYRLFFSSCDPDLTNSILEVVEQPLVCDYQLTQNGFTVMAQDCAGNTAMGSVDAAGILRFDLPAEQQTENGCTIGISPSESVPASVSPTVATFTLPITFSGACSGLSNCEIVIQATWTKL